MMMTIEVEMVSQKSGEAVTRPTKARLERVNKKNTTYVMSDYDDDGQQGKIVTIINNNFEYRL